MISDTDKGIRYVTRQIGNYTVLAVIADKSHAENIIALSQKK